jgi:hypothetical protein
MKRLPYRVLCMIALARASVAAADSERLGPPDPSRGEPYDGRPAATGKNRVALAAPRVLLFPMRLIFWGLDPPTRVVTEFDQRHHVYQHIHDALTSRDGLIGVRPEVQYHLSFRPSFGARYFDERTLGYDTSLIVLGAGGPDVAHGELIARPLPSASPVQLTVGTVYDRRNDRMFAGIDNTVPVPPGALGRSRFQSDDVDVDTVLGFHVAQPLLISVGGAFGWRNYANGEGYGGDPPIDEVYCVRRPNGECVPGTVDPRLVPGFTEGTRFLRAGAGITLDARDSAIRSTTGLLLTVGADYTHGLGHDDSQYFRIRGALTVPINLWAHRHVILFHAATTLIETIGSAPVPISELATLGGPNDLRGFRDQLLRGHSSFIATAEYRFPIWFWVDSDVFVDYGGVFGPQYANFGAHQMQPDVGWGLRLFNRDRFWLRVQVAYGWGDGWRFTISTLSWP